MGAAAHPPIRASFKSVRHLKTKMNKLTIPGGKNHSTGNVIIIIIIIDLTIVVNSGTFKPDLENPQNSISSIGKMSFLDALYKLLFDSRFITPTGWTFLQLLQ